MAVKDGPILPTLRTNEKSADVFEIRIYKGTREEDGSSVKKIVYDTERDREK